MTTEEITELKNNLDKYYKTRHSFAGLKRIMDETTAEYICSGTGRLVYRISDTRVIKIAKNNAGLAQNGVEADWGIRNLGVAAEWYDVSEDYVWIEAEFCKKAKVSDFREKTGHSFKYCCDCLRYYNSQNQPRTFISYSKPEGYDETWDEDFLGSMYYYIGSFDVPVGDLVRISSYGINQKGEIVLTDTGLNNYVYEQYYNKNK